MFYATAAAGFRPGGPNPSLVGPCTLTNVYKTAYGDDKVWNYEVGAKLEPPGTHATLNFAVFQINWHNIQQAVIDPGCGSLFTANVGEARSRGAEAELNWRPAPQVLLSGGGSYIDARFTKIDQGFIGSVPISPGDRVTDVPHVQVNASAEYRLPLTTAMTGYLRGDAHYTSSAPGSFSDRSIDTLRHSYKLLNASFGVQLPSIDVSFGVRNLSNSVIYTGAEPSSMGFGYVLVGMPRTFELNATYQLGK
jgi:outer membrane receptor protein involved in Fe transport